MVAQYLFLLVLLTWAPNFANSAPNKEALRKILVDENPDTEETREKIRGMLENAYARRPISRKMGRQPLHLSKTDHQAILGPKNNDTRHKKFEHVNKDIADYTFESDIMLNEEQAKVIAKKIEKGETRAKRQAINTPSLFWDKNSPIYYQFDSKLSATNIANVRKAIQYWNDNSCLSFSESSTAKNRLYMTSAGGCWSYVGKQVSSNYQIVSVGPQCDSLGTATHELAHAIGFWHQQSRFDRDQYVSINFANISPGQEHNFQILTQQEAPTLGLPYDYGSVMQYSPYSFALDYTKYTIYAKDMVDQNSLGQREAPAFSDLRMVNKLYNCTQRCSNQLNCANCGFTDPRRCNQCKCPRYFTGATCNDLPRGTTPSCNGRVLQATSSWTKFNALAGDPNSYSSSDAGTDCHWHIKAPAGSRIEMRLTKTLKATSICMEQCPWQSIEINLGKFDLYGMIMCCSNYVNRVFTSVADMIAIRSVVRYNQANFEIEYRTVPGSSQTAAKCSI